MLKAAAVSGMEARMTGRMVVVCMGFSLLSGLAWGQMDRGDVEFDPQRPVTDAYRESLRSEEAERAREAAGRGESFSPTFDRPTEGPPAVIPAGEAPKAEERRPDPAAERPAAPSAPAPEARAAREPPAARYEERMQERGREMEVSSPLDALLDVLAAPPGRAVWLDYQRPVEAREDGPAGDGAVSARQLPAGLAGLAVGQGLYARMLYEANSDWPGPVMLEILEPPLQGAVATGSFRAVRERLSIRIDRLSVGRESFAVSGWAVDPGCACYGIPGDVDRHWFERVLLPSAVAFANGFLEAAARTAQVVTQDSSGSSITVETSRPNHRQQLYAGAAQAADRIGSILLESAPSGPTVRVPINTEMVVVLTALPGGAAEAAAPVEGAAEPGRRGGPVAVIGEGRAAPVRAAGRGAAQ